MHPEEVFNEAETLVNLYSNLDIKHSSDQGSLPRNFDDKVYTNFVQVREAKGKYTRE